MKTKVVATPTRKRLEYSEVKGRLRMAEVLDLHDEVFLRDEPINKWCQHSGVAYDDQCLQEIRADLLQKLEQGHSIIATDPDTRAIAGGAIAFKFNRFQAGALFHAGKHLQQSMRWKLDSVIYDGMLDLERTLGPFPHFKNIMLLHALFVHPDYRGMGIAGTLTSKSMEVARKSGCDCMLVVASSDATKVIMEKLGFLKTGTLYYEDLDLSEFLVYSSELKEQSSSTYLLSLL